ncbi:cupin domain-containing protein [Thalassotalea sp. Y01]|uniref:cupin domain-containing protein n=1 Tax=Thalassotalea sp. Y01 TaxID=2729613 RepID=UPI00145EF63D|nr:cupin domain-containing protein [Thalassotalea sp. Y01]NMP16312.1 cupin domain-containing protein [Thalassotalea sp. Y01]
MKPIAADKINSQQGKPFPDPFRHKLEKCHWRRLSAPFNLSALAANMETIEPGGQSSLRHWHSHSDEFIYIISGELILMTDEGRFTMTQGMCMGFAAGDNNAHHLLNDSEQSAVYLAVGSCHPNDQVEYPDDDICWRQQDGQWQAFNKQGKPYK